MCKGWKHQRLISGFVMSYILNYGRRAHSGARTGNGTMAYGKQEFAVFGTAAERVGELDMSATSYSHTEKVIGGKSPCCLSCPFQSRQV